jgi:AcrR family transcriptional regulator
MAKRPSGQEARARILDAASEQLRREGPRGLRLDAIAEELGISRQAILHHFGTRDDLIAAVVHRALERLHLEIAGGLSVLSDHDRGSAVLVERAFEVIVDGGYGRLLAWLALEYDKRELPFGGNEELLSMLAQLSHRIRERDVGPSEFKDTLFTFVLSAYAILGTAVFEEGVFRSAGLEQDACARAEFREWLSGLLVSHLEGGRRRQGGRDD